MQTAYDEHLPHNQGWNIECADSSFRARLAGVFDLAKQHDINTLCLQDKNQRR